MVIVKDDDELLLIFSCLHANGAFRFSPVSHFREICLSINSQGWTIQLCVLVQLEVYLASLACFEGKWFSPFHLGTFCKKRYVYTL